MTDRAGESRRPAGGAEREAYVDRVTVGARVPLDGPVELAEYDPAWPRRFRRLADRVRAALGDRAMVPEHVGSTAVPGLAAKPVIDLVLAVPDAAVEASDVVREILDWTLGGAG